MGRFDHALVGQGKGRFDHVGIGGEEQFSLARVAAEVCQRLAQGFVVQPSNAVCGSRASSSFAGLGVDFHQNSVHGVAVQLLIIAEGPEILHAGGVEHAVQMVGLVLQHAGREAFQDLVDRRAFGGRAR